MNEVSIESFKTKKSVKVKVIWLTVSNNANRSSNFEIWVVPWRSLDIIEKTISVNGGESLVGIDSRVRKRNIRDNNFMLRGIGE